MTGNPQIIEGVLDAKGARFSIVASRFNHLIVDRLVEGALDALVRHGCEAEDISVVRVPGSWELPLAAKKVMEGRSPDAVICLAAIIRGATPHFDYVASECAKGVAQASLQSGVPASFGVLTCDTIEQAIERAGTKAGNKGWDAAVAAIEMVRLFEALGASP